MYGPGPAPPQSRRPSPATLVVLRVIFVLLSLFSIGFLGWAALLRVAAVTRKKSDWTLFWSGVAVVVVATIFLATDNTPDFSSWNGNLGMTMLLLSAVATTAYYLYADIRHYQAQPWQGPTGAPVHGYPQSAYGHPHTNPGHHPLPHTAPPPHPYAATRPVTDMRGVGIPGPAHTPPPAHPTGPAPTPYTTPVPVAPPQHGRIDQVRAELDELSDYLRRQSDEPPHRQEGDSGPAPDGWGPQGGGR